MDGAHDIRCPLLLPPATQESWCGGIQPPFPASPPHLNVVLLEDARLVQLHGAVEGRLAAHGDDDPVRLLALDDVLHELGGHRQEKHLRNTGIGAQRVHTLVNTTGVYDTESRTRQYRIKTAQGRQGKAKMRLLVPTHHVPAHKQPKCAIHVRKIDLMKFVETSTLPNGIRTKRLLVSSSSHQQHRTQTQKTFVFRYIRMIGKKTVYVVCSSTGNACCTDLIYLVRLVRALVVGVGLDGRDVRVHEDHLDALLLQGLDRL